MMPVTHNKIRRYACISAHGSRTIITMKRVIKKKHPIRISDALIRCSIKLNSPDILLIFPSIIVKIVYNALIMATNAKQ